MHSERKKTKKNCSQKNANVPLKSKSSSRARDGVGVGRVRVGVRGPNKISFPLKNGGRKETDA